MKFVFANNPLQAIKTAFPTAVANMSNFGKHPEGDGVTLKFIIEVDGQRKIFLVSPLTENEKEEYENCNFRVIQKL